MDHPKWTTYAARPGRYVAQLWSFHDNWADAELERQKLQAEGWTASLREFSKEFDLKMLHPRDADNIGGA